MNKKLALVLPGGGACGRWQIGVLKYLYDLGVFPRISLVCGTSVGGLNTLLVGKYLHDFEKAVDMWTRIKTNKDVFLGMLQMNTFFDMWGMFWQLKKTNKGKSLLDPAPLYNLIDLEFKEMMLKDLRVPIMITTTNMSEGEKKVFSTAEHPAFKCADLAKATSAIPLAFPGHEMAIGEMTDLHSDGGIIRNVPVCYAIEAGADRIILIGTSPDKYPRKVIKNEALAVALRLPDVIMHANEEASWDAKEDYEKLHALAPDKYQKIKFLDIYPETETGSALDFSNVEQFAAGYEYAKDTLPKEVLQAFLS